MQKGGLDAALLLALNDLAEEARESTEAVATMVCSNDVPPSLATEAPTDPSAAEAANIVAAAAAAKTRTKN